MEDVRVLSISHTYLANSYLINGEDLPIYSVTNQTNCVDLLMPFTKIAIHLLILTTFHNIHHKQLISFIHVDILINKLYCFFSGIIYNDDQI